MTDVRHPTLDLLTAIRKRLPAEDLQRAATAWVEAGCPAGDLATACRALVDHARAMPEFRRVFALSWTLGGEGWAMALVRVDDGDDRPLSALLRDGVDLLASADL